MIRIEHLTRRFHDLVAVDDISFHVPKGEIFGFLGPNGAGKSTTIRILTGFLPATSGRAVVAGLDVAQDSLGVRQQLGYLPEAVALPTDARVDEYLEYRGRLKGVPAKERGRLKERALQNCGLVPMRRRILAQLSRGYRQRVGLADAMLADPPLLILDEPTGGLDPAQRQEVLDLIAGLRGERTVLLSTSVSTWLEASAGRQGEVLVAAPGAGEKLTAWLQERSLEHHSRGDECVVQLGDGNPAELLRSLVSADLPVTRFEPRTRTLQQIFLDLTAS